MLDPYRMILINVIVSIFLLIFILFYRFVYPKKKVNLFFLLIIILILPLTSLLRKGDYESGDFNIHIHRIMSFYDSLLEGNFMPSWAAELNATYGIPVYIFNYPLPYYFVSLFHFVGFSFIGGMKIFLGLSLFLSGIFMYLWTKKLLNNKLAAFTSSIFYVFNPYHLIDVHFRATLGESLIFTLVPLVFYTVTKYIKERKKIFLIINCLFAGLLFLAHPLVAIVFIGIIFLYILFTNGINKYTFLIISSLIFGIISAIYSWLPFILYSQFTYQEPIHTYEYYFPPFQQLFYSKWKYGLLFQGPKGELALFLGYGQTLVIVGIILVLFKKKIPQKIRHYSLFWIFLVFLILFFMHPVSRNIWNMFPSFWMIFTTGRIHLPMALATSIVAGYLVVILSSLKIKIFYIYMFIAFTIASTILNWGHRKVIPEIDDNSLRKNAWLSIQITPPFMNSKWAPTPTFWFPKKPNNPMEIIQGKGTIKPLKRTTTKHLYIVYANTPITIKENTLFFPGWSLKSNYKEIPIFPDKQGVINAKLPQGLQYADLTYEDLPAYKLSKTISAGFFLGLVALLFIYALRTLIKNIKSPFKLF
ncbi:MAG: glycosyltransferase family 39 protein [Candidatus Levybacteria bacterium]|nr:glycosyltransferase family 39 protein [Candidatus Levybacteria bacterium]